MRDNPKPYEIYKHFKGNRYQILNIAKDSEDGHEVVVYQALYGDYQIYVRDLQQFMSPVDKEKYPEVTVPYRFTKVEPKAVERGAVEPEATEPKGAEPQAAEPEADTAVCPKTAAAQPEQVQTDNKSVLEFTASDGDPGAFRIDPEVERFLDADSYEDKLNILAGIRNRVTEDMLQIMAVSLDYELNPGSLDDRYKELKNCLLTRDKFECER